MVSCADITQSLHRRKVMQHECFKKILEKCFNRIKKAALVSKMQMCVYEVPEFMLGHPFYNMQECIIYLIDQLKDRGYNVRYYFPKSIVVQWAQNDSYDISDTSTMLELTAQQRLNMTSQAHQIEYMPNRVPNQNLHEVLPAKPSGNIHMPSGNIQYKSIQDFKPSGRFVLNLS